MKWGMVGLSKKTTSKSVCCKGICIRYKAKRSVRIGYYRLGFKRCNTCELFIKWEGRMCPCCGYQLRMKPRDRALKEKLREIAPVVRI